MTTKKGQESQSLVDGNRTSSAVHVRGQRTQNPTLVQLVAVANLSKEKRLEGREVGTRSAVFEEHDGSFPVAPRQKALPFTANQRTDTETVWFEIRRKGQAGVPRTQVPTQVGGTTAGSSNAGLADVNRIMKMGHEGLKLFHASNEKQPICINLQNRLCADPSCLQQEPVCIGCATEGRPYIECHCVQSKLN